MPGILLIAGFLGVYWILYALIHGFSMVGQLIERALWLRRTGGKTL